MSAKKCEFCGRMFYSKSTSKKYCTQVCKKEARKIKLLEDGQKCWNCKKATGGCSWSNAFVPVNGWDATPCMINEQGFDEIYTYEIKDCPEFICG